MLGNLALQRRARLKLAIPASNSRRRAKCPMLYASNWPATSVFMPAASRAIVSTVSAVSAAVLAGSENEHRLHSCTQAADGADANAGSFRLNPLNRLKFPTALEMPLLCPIVARARQPREKRGVETVGDGVSSPLGWHVDCVWAKPEPFDPDVRRFAAREHPNSNAIRMEPWLAVSCGWLR